MPDNNGNRVTFKDLMDMQKDVFGIVTGIKEDIAALKTKVAFITIGVALFVSIAVNIAVKAWPK